MKVAISMSVRADVRPPDFLRQNYVIYLESLGLLPVPTPNMLSDLHAWLDALGIEGVVLSGGGDIGPDAYGQPNNGAIEVHRERDRTEWGLLDWAIAHRRPVLGICRGIQVLNVYFGGQLIQDLPSHNDRFIAHDGSESHAVRLTDPRVAALLGTDTMDVNTYHHQGITPDVLAPALEPFAICRPDGLIEGVFHRELPILGVQWHPERPTPSRELDLRLFRHFFHRGAFWLETGPGARRTESTL